MSAALTSQWLRQNTSIYPANDRVYADVEASLQAIPTLRPKTDVYTYDDGRTQLLLCVHGLLPIQYRQSSYHIPIAIWLPRDYPRDPPISYVVPTSDMLVKPGKHMDVSGRANVDYSQDWQRKSEGCNLLSLVQAMQAHFSRDPPLYSKPKQSPQTANQPQVAEQQGPRPPDPPPATTRPPPVVPPKPPASISPPLLQPASPSAPRAPLPPAAQSLANGSGPPSSTSSSRYQSPVLPPKPPSVHPATVPTIVPAYVHAHARSSSVTTPHSPTLWNQQHQQQQPPPPPFQPGSVAAPASPAPAAPLAPVSGPNPVSRWSVPPAAPTPAPPPPPSVHAATHPYVLPAPVQPLPPPQSSAPVPTSVPVHVPTPNLLDEDEDDAVSAPIVVSPAPAPALAPPRPPNPELLRLHDQARDKLATELASLAQAMAHDAERLRAHQRDLLAGEPAIRDESARLAAVRDVCLGVVARVGPVVSAAEARVEEMRRKGEPPVDELVCSTSIVHNQLVELVAEDNAIEDTIYHLHRALNAGRIDLDRFIRTTRVLAEEQFMKRALAEKILNALPMSGAGGWA